MQTTETIRARRSVKHYDPDFKMPSADEKQLFDLARQSPTSFNMQNWRFVNVKNKDLRSKIREAAWGQAQITEASMLLILCADVKAWDKDPARYWEKAPKEVQDYLVPMIKPFYDSRDWQQRDEAMRSIGISAQTLMLAAKDMGYDSCPMIGFDADAVAKIIKLPEDHVIGMILVIGKALKPAQPKGGFIPDEEVFIEDTF